MLHSGLARCSTSIRGETPRERLTGKAFNYGRLNRTWGSERFMHEHQQQRGAAANFHRICKARHFNRGTAGTHPAGMRSCRRNQMLVNPAHVTFQSEDDKFRHRGGIFEAVDLNDEDGDSAERRRLSKRGRHNRNSHHPRRRRMLLTTRWGENMGPAG